MTKEVTIEPGETIKINGLTGLKGNTKRLHIVAEPMEQGGGNSYCSYIFTVYARFSKSTGNGTQCNQ